MCCLNVYLFTICVPGTQRSNWSYRQMQVTKWVLGINLDPLQGQPML